MRRIFLLFAFIVAASSINAQTPILENMKAFIPDSINEDGEWYKVIETNLTAEETFKYAQASLASIVNNYQDNVQVEDKENKKIVCKVRTGLVSFEYIGNDKYEMVGQYNFILTLTFKDNKFRARGEKVLCNYNMRALGIKNKEELYIVLLHTSKGNLEKDFKRSISRFLYFLMEGIKKQQQDSDF